MSRPLHCWQRAAHLLIVPQLLSAVELVFGLDVNRQVREERLDELISDLKG